MSFSYRFEHIEKKRYYHLILAQDMLGDWVITKAWGGIQRATGRITHHPYHTFDEAMSCFEKYKKYRERRGYVLIG